MATGDLAERFWGISLSRVLLHPCPGTATEQDVLDIEQREQRRCELVDGVLVEKVMGFRESLLAIALSSHLREFVIPRNLGVVSGEAGMLRLMPGLVRIPDVAFISWRRIPGGQIPPDPVPSLTPDLVVEVLSEGNTAEEMGRGRRDYFSAGTVIVWEIDPDNRTVTVHAGPDRSLVLDEGQILDGGDVLPGFSLALSELFGELDRQGG